MKAATSRHELLEIMQRMRGATSRHDQRTMVSFGLSALTHAGVLIALALTVTTQSLPVRPRLEERAPLQAALVARTPLVAPAPDLVPIPLVTPPPLTAPIMLSPPSVALVLPQSAPRAPSAINRSEPTNQSADEAPPEIRIDSGTYEPIGNVAVGALDDPTRFGRLAAGRIAREFPTAAARLPRLRGSLAVVYPPEALTARKMTRVMALLTLDANGKVVGSTLSPNIPQFGPAVMEALKSAQFAPAEIAGNPVPYWAILEFVFTIEQPR